MTVVSVALGLLAPVSSFAIASGSGINALSNVSQVSQNFGINTGAAYYTPGMGSSGDTPPASQRDKDSDTPGRAGLERLTNRRFYE